MTRLVDDAARRLIDLGILRNRPDLLTPPLGPLERAAEAVGDVLGFAKSTLFTRIAEHLEADHTHRLEERVKALNWELFDRAVGAADWSALEELSKLARDRKLAARDAAPGELASLRAALDKPFAERLLLWKKTKADLVEEMSTALQMPGWGNSFTQPIANRIEMLSTGVRLPVAVKVFGSKLDDIQRVSQEIADVLRGVRGAADVFADQVVGKGYVEIKIDRKKAARYGINVGDVQDVVEVAMGGRPLTMTVEGRERYPVRVRYSRDYRDDVEALKGILVSSRGMAADAGQGGMGGGMGAGGMPAAAAPGPAAAGADPPGRGRRHPGGRGAVDDQERERPAPLVRPAPRPRGTRPGRLRRGGAAGRPGKDRAREDHLSSGMYLEWTGTFEHQVRAQQDACGSSSPPSSPSSR